MVAVGGQEVDAAQLVQHLQAQFVLAVKWRLPQRVQLPALTRLVETEPLKSNAMK